MSTLGWWYFGIGLVFSIPTFIIAARINYRDMSQEPGFCAFLSFLAAAVAVVGWIFFAGALIAGSIIWTLYQLATPGEFELPDFLQALKRDKELKT